ncbi:hypothetical protein LTS12_028449, partial [Elasticomyces elasticus]
AATGPSRAVTTSMRTTPRRIASAEVATAMWLPWTKPVRTMTPISVVSLLRTVDLSTGQNWMIPWSTCGNLVWRL